MLRPRLVLSLALLGSLVAGGVGAVVFEGGPDPVIFPRQEVPIYFTHAYHVRKPDPKTGVQGEGLDCDFCHENISESHSSEDRDIPGHGSCDTCHDEWIGDEDNPAPLEECARCHRDLSATPGTETSTFAAKILIPKPNIRFSHQQHISHDVECVACHDQVPKRNVATRSDYPTMDRCIACHAERGASTECRSCHLSGVGGRLITEFAQGKLMPRRLHRLAIHDADFLRDHAATARRDQRYCASCHAQSDCLECHDGVGRDVRYHPGDWIALHSIKARIDDNRCQSCHRLQSFCINCHIRSSRATVLPVNAAAPPAGQTFRTRAGRTRSAPHPLDESWTNPGSRNFHGFHAQRNIKACVGCHQEQYCLQCHTVGGIAGNPHGPNPQRLRNSTARKQNARMCLKCHDPLDESWR